MQINTISPSFKGSYSEVIVPKKITANVKWAADKIRPLLQEDAKNLHRKDNLTLEIFTDSMRIIHRKIDTHKKTSSLRNTVITRISNVIKNPNANDGILYTWYEKTMKDLFPTKRKNTRVPKFN